MNVEGLITSVVMVGHSLFGFDNPAMLEQLLSQRDQPVPITVEAQIINGAPLSYNWEHAERAEGINARQRLQTPADVVIVTEAIPLANHLKWSGSEAAITQFYELARSSNPEVKFYLQETWHSLASGTGAEIRFDAGAATPWRQRLDEDLPRWQALVDEVNDATGGEITLLPAGQAMARLEDAIRAGTIPGHQSIQGFFDDDIHPNALGFYYLSLVQFAVITGEPPEGLPRQLQDRWGKRFSAPSPALAKRLQELAWATAQGAEVKTAALPEDPPPPPADPSLPSLNGPLTSAASQEGPEARAPGLTSGLATVLPLSRQPIAMNLMPVADWSPQAPFIDHFKTARPWIGHLPGQWGGVNEADLRQAGYLDPDGWPTAIPPELGSIGTVILTDLPEAARSLAGRYILRFEGKGIVEVSGRATNQRYGTGEVSFDYTPGPGPVEIRIQRIEKSGDYIRNISVVKQSQLEAYEQGALFNPNWLAHLDGFAALRFMDWMETNNSHQIGWEDRPRVRDYSWARKGVPAEVMIALANELGAAPWFNMPHMADDSYVRNFAQLVRDKLDFDLRAYVEYSNEVWNWQFEQAGWADQQAQMRWGDDDLWMQFYGGRAAEVSQIWSQVFDSEATQRLVRVLATQTGWLGLEEQILTSPLWVAEKPDRQPPATYFDAYAVTGYFGGILGTKERAPILRAWLSESRGFAREQGQAAGLTGQELDRYVIAHQFDVATLQAATEIEDGLVSGDSNDTLHDLLTRVLPYHKEVATRHDLDLVLYEGGSHVVGLGHLGEDSQLTAFFTHFNYTAEMGALYRRLLAGLQDLDIALFAAYADVSTPGKWGSWGALRYLSDENPRWSALEAVK